MKFDFPNCHAFLVQRPFLWNILHLLTHIRYKYICIGHNENCVIILTTKSFLHQRVILELLYRNGIKLMSLFHNEHFNSYVFHFMEFNIEGSSKFHTF